MRQIAIACLLLLAAAAASIAPCAAPVPPGAAGPEFQVSSVFPPRLTYTYSFGPAADLADTGDFLVVWASDYVVSRAFDPSSAPRGGEVVLGDGTFGYFPESPDVTAGASQFVVVWSDYFGVMGGSVVYGVRAQRFGLQGQPEGPRLDLSLGYFELNGEVAVEPQGDFIVVWDYGFVARGRRFDSTGSPTWPEKTMGLAGQISPDPDVAVDALGNFSVVWSHRTQVEPRSIRAQRFDSAGALLNPTFTVSEFPPGSQSQPAIAARPDGGFVAAWRSTGQDGSTFGVFGRTFDGSLQPTGGEFPVNTTAAGFQDKPDVGADDRGNFVVVWQSGTHYGQADQVMGQRFDAAGNRVGGEFLINEIYTAGQRLPAIGMRGDGEFLVTWYSTQSDCCTPWSSVRARRFCATPNVSAPASLSLCEGDTALFDVAATGREPFFHQWRRDALPLFDDGRISGVTNPALSISPASPSDTGLYDCEVTDACPDSQSLVSAAAQLTVEPRPAEVADLEVRMEDGGATLRFTWTPASGAHDYVVHGDAVSGGAFPELVGAAPDPATGLAVPMPAGNHFYLVAGRSPICGEGPLR